jgi:predicted nucleic acid-binding protein
VICVDSSVAAKWVLSEADADKAVALYEDAARARERVVAPPLLPIEVTNIVWQRVRRQMVTLADAEEILRRFLAFRVTLLSPGTLHHDALRIAASYFLPATYDAYYVALAQQIDAALWTADARLLNTLDGRLTFVQPLSSYRPATAGREGGR